MANVVIFINETYCTKTEPSFERNLGKWIEFKCTTDLAIGNIIKIMHMGESALEFCGIEVYGV